MKNIGYLQAHSIIRPKTAMWHATHRRRSWAHVHSNLRYVNPTPMVSDSLQNYTGEAAPAFQFLYIVPTTWDETHVLGANSASIPQLFAATVRSRIWAA